MEITCRSIKEDARRSLKGKWTIVVLCTLLCGNFNFILNFIPDRFYLYALLWIISIVLFKFGYNCIILQATRENNIEFSKFISGYKMSFKALGMIILIGIYTLLWSMLLFIPGIIARIKYSMAYFIWVDDPNIGINEAIERSIDITYGHKWEIFKLNLSFIGWYLLIAILSYLIIHYTIFSSNYLLIRNCGMGIISIASIYLYTYVTVSQGALYNKLREEKLGLN